MKIVKDSLWYLTFDANIEIASQIVSLRSNQHISSVFLYCTLTFDSPEGTS